MAYLNVSR